jgi:hypothetical protein
LQVELVVALRHRAVVLELRDVMQADAIHIPTS